MVLKASFWSNNIIKGEDKRLFYSKEDLKDIWNFWPES